MKKCGLLVILFICCTSTLRSMDAAALDDQLPVGEKESSEMPQRLIHLGQQEDWITTMSYLWEYLRMGLKLEVDFSQAHFTGFKNDFFKGWNGVVVLNLSNNKIRILPGSIATIKTLKKLDVTGNPLEKTDAMIALRAQLVAQGVMLIGWTE